MSDGEQTKGIWIFITAFFLSFFFSFSAHCGKPSGIFLDLFPLFKHATFPAITQEVQCQPLPFTVITNMTFSQFPQLSPVYFHSFSGHCAFTMCFSAWSYYIGYIWKIIPWGLAMNFGLPRSSRGSSAHSSLLYGSQAKPSPPSSSDDSGICLRRGTFRGLPGLASPTEVSAWNSVVNPHFLKLW